VSNVVEIENLGKRYTIGAKERRHDTLVDLLSYAIKSPLRRYKHLKGKYNENDETSFWALRNVSFAIETGDVVGIVGRNGAGKSTLLKILSRITDPTEGYVGIKGRVASLLEVGTGFHPDLTGRENIFLNGAILGMTQAEIRRKFDEIVAFSEIEKFLDTPVKHYSSGMYIRLAFSVAAHLEPEILIVDEVLAVGDIMFQKKCLGKMGDVSKSGRTILFVSHNMGAVRNLCNKGVLLENGNCKMLGTSNEVVDYYMRSVSNNLSNPIRNRKRTYPGLPVNVRITNVEIENVRLGCLNEAETLDEILVKIDYEILEDVDYFTAEWRLKDIYGSNLAYSNATHMGGIVFHPKKGEQCGQVVCKIPSIPLAIGEYVLEVGVGIPSVRYFDRVDDACRLTIRASDPMGTGYAYKSEDGPFFINCQWSEK
jgi:homopolymeric O-antigen transport system ATP-binding protein